MPREPRVVDELLQRILANAPAPGVHESTCRGITFLRADQPMRRRAACYEPSLVVVAQGRKVAWLDGERCIAYDPLHFLIVALPLPVEAEILEASPERPFLAVKVQLDQAITTEVLAALEADDTDEPDAPPRPAMVSSPMDARLLDVVLRLLRACDDEVERRLLAESLQRELVLRLARGPQAWVLRQLVHRDHQAQRVARAIHFAGEHLAESIGIADLARAAHMAESTFHRAFREVTGTTPLRYLKNMRLHQARNLMLHRDLTAAEAAAQVGYRSPSQFSREFRVLFGGPPRSVVAAMRAEAARA